MTFRVFIGWDSRETRAYAAAVKSLLRYQPNAHVSPLKLPALEASGLIRRPMDRRGQMYDLASNAPCSTEFAISRFLVPIIALDGWALFVDCDVIFLGDVAELFAHADPSKAVMVVKHEPLTETGHKMDGQKQTVYPRKNWSSVCLWNCNHPANKRLSLRDVNERRGFDLHGFYWLADSEIGELPSRFNWLVGVNPKPDNPLIAHYTLGTPDMVSDCPYPEYFWDAEK